jgi:hypothetical protein
MPRTANKKGLIPPNAPKGKRAKPVNVKLNNLLAKTLPTKENEELDIDNAIFTEPIERGPTQLVPPIDPGVFTEFKALGTDIKSVLENIKQLYVNAGATNAGAVEKKEPAPVPVPPVEKKDTKADELLKKIELAKKARIGNLRL